MRCLRCAEPIERRPGRGRPQVYCGPACRRSVELEVRRIVRRLERLENRVSNLRLQHYPMPVIRATEAELARLEARLRALLGHVEVQDPAAAEPSGGSLVARSKWMSRRVEK